MNRFRREVIRSGVFRECKRRRFFENNQDKKRRMGTISKKKKKRKARQAARRNKNHHSQRFDFLPLFCNIAFLGLFVADLKKLKTKATFWLKYEATIYG